MFLMCAAMTGTVKAQEEKTVIKVVPTPYTAPTIGHRFTLNVTVYNLTVTSAHDGCWSWMVRIRWNSSVLNVTSRADVVEGDFLKKVNPDTSFRFWDPRPGQLPEITGRFNVEAEATGDGSLVKVTFTAVGLGTTNVTVYEYDFIDFDGDPIPITNVFPGRTDVVPEFSTSIMLALFLVTTTAIAILAKKLSQKKPILH